MSRVQGSFQEKARARVEVSGLRSWVARELENLVLSFAMIREGEIAIPKSSELSTYLEEAVLSWMEPEKVVAQELMFWQVALHIHTYILKDDVQTDDACGDDEVAGFSMWTLPSKNFRGIWESLILEQDIKNDLVRYCLAALVFSKMDVNTNLVSCNRLILLHGPPGTGKTSLCKAMSQKLSIQLQDEYAHALLFEVHTQGLFSKFFSESAKLVGKTFSRIQSCAADQTTLVFVLIDEVESLTSSREAALSGSEPSDAVRVVNAVLTQVDALRRFPNVFMMTTSNITGAIDTAFVDRADIKQFIGPPSKLARRSILSGALAELARAQIIDDFFPEKGTKELDRLAEATNGFSGRLLRKLPFLTFSKFASAYDKRPIPSIQFLSEMAGVAETERTVRGELASVEQKLRDSRGC
ncbi:hypothetical protein NDN08_007366 [Rhodosorus marinus]|uniref:AAA+ ATPase domain-containing protein n=1 Tax=Rhodosorus marinus TaxID=101924 RepID=A0AAV8UK18_9RHOD|nr:hypothetical protein NDN08_007366 [Rhodosorus marinus]